MPGFVVTFFRGRFNSLLEKKDAAKSSILLCTVAMVGWC